MLYRYLPILPEHVWKNVPARLAGSSYQNEPPLVCSGPFLVTEWQRGKFIRLERNPNYWGKQPGVDEIIFSIYQSPETMTADLKAGTIDAAQDILPAQYNQLSSTEGIEGVAYNYRSWDYLCFNCYEGDTSSGNPVLLDPKFRVALDWAGDRQKLAEVAYCGWCIRSTCRPTTQPSGPAGHGSRTGLDRPSGRSTTRTPV
jgi:peptide/nickel transport system substrate-binding protein